MTRILSLFSDKTSAAEQGSNLLDIREHEAQFASYIQEYLAAEQQDSGPMLLKKAHSARVLAHARRIVAEEQIAPLTARACLLGALYHDIARFPQFARWRTFKDADSVNHGLAGAIILKRRGYLAEEVPALRQQVLAAVAMHNRYRLPAVNETLRYITAVVRDADKLDIFHIMAEHLCGSGPRDGTVVLHVKEDPALWTPAVVEDVLHGRVISYGALRSVNDFRLLLGTWLHDLRFTVTRQELKHSGILPRLLEALPPAAPVQEAKRYLLSLWDQIPS